MPYVYKITNDINDKIYVGKTMFSIQERFNQHINDSKRDRNKNRPLYRAIRKYGSEHFTVSLIEEVNSPLAAEFSEVYWIEYYDSYKHGYNATKGGDGKSYLDYDYIYQIWKENDECSMAVLADKLGMEGKEGYLSRIIKVKGGTLKAPGYWTMRNLGNPVVQIDKRTHKRIAEYESARCAGRTLTGKNGTFHIEEVCNGKRHTALGYLWLWKSEFDSTLEPAI